MAFSLAKNAKTLLKAAKICGQCQHSRHDPHRGMILCSMLSSTFLLQLLPTQIRSLDIQPRRLPEVAMSNKLTSGILRRVLLAPVMVDPEVIILKCVSGSYWSKGINLDLADGSTHDVSSSEMRWRAREWFLATFVMHWKIFVSVSLSCPNSWVNSLK